MTDLPFRVRVDIAHALGLVLACCHRCGCYIGNPECGGACTVDGPECICPDNPDNTGPYCEDCAEKLPADTAPISLDGEEVMLCNGCLTHRTHCAQRLLLAQRPRL
jgi:hypothetical protein